MGHDDVEAIARIELASPSAWSAFSIAEELLRVKGVQLVATDEAGHIIAWCCGQCLDDEAELFKIAVSVDRREQGIGTALLARFEDMCMGRGCESCFLEVRASNFQAIGLYENLGYSKIGCRKDYYSAPQEDALVLQKFFRLQT
jgi:ribosomal-protein-alanine N-acetyltransferase